MGLVDQAMRHKETYDLVKDTVDESEKTVEALERSKYSYIIEVAGGIKPARPSRKRRSHSPT